MGEHDEIATYRGSIAQRMRLLRHAVDGLDASQLNFKPSFAGSNSIWVLATHALGNAQAWILGIACGREMSRDRPAEFADDPDSINLRVTKRTLTRRFRATLAREVENAQTRNG